MGTKKAAKKTASPKTRFRTIRVSSEVYDQVHKVLGDVNQKGWDHFGVDRRDAASLTSVVAEAIGLLAKAAG